MSTTTDPMFDTNPYHIDLPNIDGHDPTTITIRFGGTIKLNRNNPDHTTFFDNLKLGTHKQLNVTATIDTKAHALKIDEHDNEQLTSIVALRIHAIDLEP